MFATAIEKINTAVLGDPVSTTHRPSRQGIADSFIDFAAETQTNLEDTKTIVEAGLSSFAGKFYGTFAEADADTGNLALDDFIQIAIDENAAGKRTLRRWDGTTLLFVRNFVDIPAFDDVADLRNNTDVSFRIGFLEDGSVFTNDGTVGHDFASEDNDEDKIVDAAFQLWSAAYLVKKITYLDKRQTMAGLIGSSDTDRAAAMTAALSTLDKGVYVNGQNQTFRADTSFTVPSGLIIEDITIDFSRKVAGGDTLLCSGSIGPAMSLTSDITMGVYKITLTPVQVATVVKGDTLFFLSDDVFCSVWNGTSMVPNVLNNSWYATVHDIDGNDVILNAGFPHEFPMTVANNARVHVADMHRGNRFINVSGFGDPAINQQFMLLSYCEDYEVSGGRIDDAKLRARLHYRNNGGRVRDTRVVGSNMEGFGYGDVGAGTMNVKLFNNTYDDNRHGPLFGGEGEIDLYPVIEGNTINGCRAAGVDFHPAVIGGVIKDNTINIASRHRDIWEGGNWGQKEGIVSQGAMCSIVGNKISGVSGGKQNPDDAGVVPALDGNFILAQLLTNYPMDTVRITDNEITAPTGPGVFGINVQNQKDTGKVRHVTISDNDLNLVAFGGTGTLSPVGISITNYRKDEDTRRITLSGNSVFCRGTALFIRTVGTGVIQDVSVVGGNYETINTDSPVFDFVKDAGTVLTRISTSANLRGGSYSIRNGGSIDRIVRCGGFITQPVSGTVFEVDGLVDN